MDPRTFDRWTVAIARPPTRRAALRLLAGGVLALFVSPRQARAAMQGDECAVGLTDCGGFCVDLFSDGDNCGACGNVCPYYPEIFNCEGGVCVPPSCAPLTNCGGLCADLLSDSLHCGACGVACAAGQACQFGVCTASSAAPPSSLTCAPGLTDCFNFCVDLSFDPNNCGACGIACSSGGICTFGVCSVGGGEQGEAVACAPGLVACGGFCVDISTDPSNCGACGAVCVDSCQGGACFFAPSDDFNSDPRAGNGGVAACRGIGVACDFNDQCCNTPTVQCCWDGISLQVECTDVTPYGGQCPM